MVWIENKAKETSEGPGEITIENVVYWSRHSKELNGSQVSKALKFVKYDCMKYIGDRIDLLGKLAEHYQDAKHVFLCLPLNTAQSYDFFGYPLHKKPFESDYNFSEYIIYKRSDGTFSCNCQGYVSKEKRGEIIPGGANCSHILALLYCFKMRKFGRRNGATEQQVLPDIGGK